MTRNFLIPSPWWVYRRGNVRLGSCLLHPYICTPPATARTLLRLSLKLSRPDVQQHRSFSQKPNGITRGSPPASIPGPPNNTTWPGSNLNTQNESSTPEPAVPPPEDPANVWISATREGKEDTRRTLVLCFDGTGDEFDSDNSNIVRLVSMLCKENTSRQLVYYQAGMATYPSRRPVTAGFWTMLDKMLATNLSTRVKLGYEFIMQNYIDGDRICLFGFSRGAYTARALAGMLQKVGLLSSGNYAQIKYAYDMYTREDPQGLELAEDFKETFCRHVNVDFIGVWDTVASVGVFPRYLPFTTENNGVRHLRHALALDERRVKFLPSYCFTNKKGVDHHDSRKSAGRRFEEAANAREGQKCDVSEVWFAGVHADVGGGSVANDTRSALHRISLRWMIRECFKCNAGVVFDAAKLQQLGLNLSVKHDPRDGTQVELCDPPKRLSPPLVAPEDPVEKPEIITCWTPILSALSTCGSLLGGLTAIILFPFVTVLSIMDDAVHLLIRRRSAHRGWMSESARGKNGIGFGASSRPLYKLRDNLDESHEAKEEREDALTPHNDRLQESRSWKWYILEWVPQLVKDQRAITHGWPRGYKFKWNRGQGREIPADMLALGPFKVHRSVKTRLEDTSKRELYVPQVRPASELRRGEPYALTHREWNVENPKLWKWVD